MIDGGRNNFVSLAQDNERREARMIRRMQDRRCKITDDPKEGNHIFVAQLGNEYVPIEVTDSYVAEMVSAIRPTDRTTTRPIWSSPSKLQNYTLPLNPEATTRLRGPMASA